MSVIETLVTDRTQADVKRWKELKGKDFSTMTDAERKEWLGGMKGTYNAADLNRVGEAVEFIRDQLFYYGYDVSKIIGIRTDWEIEDIPTMADMERYLENVHSLWDLVHNTEPDLPESMNRLSYEGANAIEKTLLDIDIVITRIFGSFKRSGQFTFWSGYLPLPASKSDSGRTWEELDAMDTMWANWQVADWYLLLYGNLKAEGVVS